MPALKPVPPGSAFRLSSCDPAFTQGLSRGEGERGLEKMKKKLDELESVFYADGRHRLLLVFQAMDTAGKDGVIRAVVSSFDPQGVSVKSFKKPTAEEAAHHYLWRIKLALEHAHGRIAVFNRSHYEDILVPTVFKTLPAKTVEKRYAEINAWEKELVESGWTILKFFLHISKAEQKRRLQARLDDPAKNWKFSMFDLECRRLWDDFQAAYEKIIRRTSTAHAPWHVIPANKKWHRDYAVARIVKQAMKRMKLRYPPPPAELADVVIPD